MLRKRVIAVILTLTAAVSAVSSAYGASLSNMRVVRGYANEFTDITAEDWYYNSIVAGYEYGFIDGRGNGAFTPEDPVTVAETIKIAASIRSVYETGYAVFAENTIWYEPYVSYAIEYNIITPGQFAVMDTPVTRADFAKILSQALPEEAYAYINEVPDGTIPDVPMIYTYSRAVYALYRAGILTGSDAKGTFYPNRNISRAEAAVVTARIMRPVDRVSQPFTMPVLSGESLYEVCAPAVFLIEIYDDKDEVVRTGSGFFISADGLAVTNCHVAANIKKAVITTHNGEKYDVLGIYDRDLATDCALIQIGGTGFQYLSIRDSETVRTGEEIFALSSPAGLINSLSRGIVSAVNREISGTSFIQLDAAISSGSSGGALLDSRGLVIGITSAAVTGGENLNLAMPINVINALNDDKYVSCEDYEKSLPYYEGYFPAPDYGIFAGATLLFTEKLESAADYYYRLLSHDERVRLSEGYVELLKKNGFTLYFEAVDENQMTIYVNNMFGLAVMFGVVTHDNVRYWGVEVMLL